MTATTQNIPISVNYTGRDYYALRTELITRVQDRIPNWTATDPSDFGVALVEAFSYLGDLLGYYIDRAANETSIYTATQRNSILNLAQTYGYVPAGYRQSYVDLTFTNSSSSSVTIPEGTVVSGQVTNSDVVTPVYFTTVADLTIDPNSSDVVTATEGRLVSYVSTNVDNTYGELIGTSDGTPNLSFPLTNTPVVDDATTLHVYVQDGTSYSEWKQVQHIVDYGPLDLVYDTYLDENNVLYINFGDGTSGTIPVIYSSIRAMYIVGGGIIGNINTSIIDTLVSIPGLSENQVTAIQSTVTVTNSTVAVGGSNPESNDQIRAIAPKTIRAANRAVTLDDFKRLALSVSGVGHANAVASTWSSVTIYIAPSRNDNDPDLQPGLDSYGSPTLEYSNLSSAVSGYLATRTLIGTSVTVQPPTYIDIVLSIQYTKYPQYTSAEVEKVLKSTIISTYGYNGVDFAEVITPQNIEKNLNTLSQIKSAKLTVLTRAGGSGLNTLTGAANELFRFQESNISLASS